ncbi:FecCD family ABC transporter permease [Actinotignum schaalii]|uniref:FecCD family ABC transporter permease n=1 Tax=Actinotignum schaalii TaxID=59505 RepID=UPI00373EEC2A
MSGQRGNQRHAATALAAVASAPVMPALPAGIKARRRRRIWTFLILTLLLALGMLLSAHLGQFPVTVGEVARGIAARFGLAAPPEDPLVMAALWNIRFPRICLGILVGGALAVAGAVMQAVFSNPLAEPGIIGVSSGCAFGAALTMVFIPGALGGLSVPLGAFVAGLVTSATVYLLARSQGRAETLTLVLTGIAVTAVGSALTSIATYLADTNAREQIVFWQMGSLAGASWFQVAVVGAVVGIGILGALGLAGRLDLLSLGEREAGHVGVNVAALRAAAIVLTAILTAAAVCFAGVIGFVGLIVPHVLRLLMGPMNRMLIPAALLGGAVLLTYADLAARTLVPFAELPIGIFTALVGGPTFFILLRKNLRGARG